MSQDNTNELLYGENPSKVLDAIRKYSGVFNRYFDLKDATQFLLAYLVNDCGECSDDIISNDVINIVQQFFDCRKTPDGVAGKTPDEVAETTGFRINYVRKILQKTQLFRTKIYPRTEWGTYPRDVYMLDTTRVKFHVWKYISRIIEKIQNLEEEAKELKYICPECGHTESFEGIFALACKCPKDGAVLMEERLEVPESYKKVKPWLENLAKNIY